MSKQKINHQTRKEIAVCLMCKGEGSVRRPATFKHGSFDDSKIEVCQGCLGSGLVEVQEEIITYINSYSPKKIKEDEQV